MFAVASLLVLAAPMYGLRSKDEGPRNRKAFFQRLAATYVATLLISAALLFGVHRFDSLNEPLTALKRAVLVALPASFAAAVVDSLGGTR
jgi:uncharacterized membrane protein